MKCNKWTLVEWCFEQVNCKTISGKYGQFRLWVFSEEELSVCLRCDNINLYFVGIDSKI